MELIDRLEEVARLRAAADAPPQLVVIQGRRRVGKSFLIERALRGRRMLYVQADQQDESGHLALLAAEGSGLIAGRPPLRFDDWDAVLAFLGDQATIEPLVVVLDEFQWLWNAQPALDSMIQRHWDRWQRAGTPITLILAGSSLIHMDRLLEHSRPLYGRADYRPVLQPLDYRWAAAFAETEDATALLRRYAVVGGTPQYQVWAGRGPIRRVIAERILTKGESLYEEPLHLLREEQAIRTAGGYFDVLRAIARGVTRHNEIAQQASLETALLARMLRRLVALGYVEARAPLEADGFAGRRASYRVLDPFLRFWFRYVFPNRSRLELGRVAEVLDGVMADLDTYMGLAFEDCCREWLGRYATGFPEVLEIGGWWDRVGRTEIDVVATTRGRYAIVGSCKWDRAADARVLAQLRRDAEALGPRAGRARLVIFARGFHPSLARVAEEEDVRLVTADELFEERAVPP
jgi:AAA+ ATPase superfamily predicted ATPase